jgi:hypothetical protein
MLGIAASFFFRQFALPAARQVLPAAELVAVLIAFASDAGALPGVGRLTLEEFLFFCHPSPALAA